MPLPPAIPKNPAKLFFDYPADLGARRPKAVIEGAVQLSEHLFICKRCGDRTF